MSLLLRKECQPALDESGLADYHAGIVTVDSWSKTRYLGVLGPCGKQLFMITGISFNRASPNRGEIMFAAELLGDFLRTHKKVLEDFLATQRILASNKYPKTEFAYDTRIALRNGAIASYSTETETLSYFSKTGEYQYKTEKFIPLASIGKLSKDRKVRDKLKSLAKQVNKWKEADFNFEEAKEALTTCNI